MQTYIYIDNFRGFTNALIPLREVNFLVGENSTGKTSFLQLIETFSNMSFWFFEPRFGIPGTQQRHFLDLVSASSTSKKAFTVGTIGPSNKNKTETFGMIVTYHNVDGRPVPSRVSVIEGASVRTVDGYLWRSKKGDKYKSRIKECREDSLASDDPISLSRLIAIHKSASGFVESRVSEEMEGPIFLRFSEVLFDGKNVDEDGPKAPYPFKSQFIELAPIRTKPKRTYDAPQTEFSPEGEHTPYIIKKRLTSKTHATNFKKFLEEAGQSSGLFKSITINQYGRGPQAPFEIKIVLGNTSLGLENVGYGVSQALPVLVEMFVRPKRTAFAIQQPEVHLHPRAQATFGDLIAELARADEKKFLIETHSDFTIDRFRLNVRKHGAISSQLLFFERNETGNTVYSIPIQENGDLCADQPEAYRSFFYNESLELLS